MFRAIKEDEVSKQYISEGKENKREIGGQATWTLSTAKPGFGVEQLRDDNIETYWQSDGAQPHSVSIQFPKKSTVEEICIYSDFKLDESYTPARISIKAGTTYHDLQEIKTVDIEEPTGWVSIALMGANNLPLRTNFIQLLVLANHQNGRDTHIRQIKIYGPRQSITELLGIPQFADPMNSMYNEIR